MDIEGEECPSDISTEEREIVSWDCPSNMDLGTNWDWPSNIDLGTNWLVQFDGPLRSPDHHYLSWDCPSNMDLGTNWLVQFDGYLPLLPSSPVPSSSVPLSPLRNFEQMSPSSWPTQQNFSDVRQNGKLRDRSSLTMLDLCESSLTMLDSCDCLSLTMLDLRECSSLTRLDLREYSSLTRLDLLGCWSLTRLDLLGYWSLTRLNLCYYSSLTTLDLSGCSSLTKLGLRYCSSLTTLDLHGCSSLITLDLFSCGSLTRLDLRYCSSLTTLNLFCCSYLTRLDLPCYSSLTWLDLRNCSSLTTLDLLGCSSLTTLHLSSRSLTRLDLRGCRSLTRLDLLGCCSLTRLDLCGCQSLTRLDLLGYRSLTRLDMSYCSSLTRLDLRFCSSLTMLDLYYCSSLTTLNLRNCSSLTRLDLCHCSFLTRLDLCYCSSLTRLRLRSYLSLTRLDLRDCLSLTTLGLRGFSSLTTLDLHGCSSLTTLDLHGCSSLTTLDRCGCSSLTDLRSLNMTTLVVSDEVWPEELFPIPVCMIEDRMTQSLRCMIGRTAEYALSLVREPVKNDGYQCTLTTTSNELQRSKVASLWYMFSLDDARAADDPAGLHTIPGIPTSSSSSSSVKLKLPFCTPNVQFYNHKDSSSYWVANIDQCYTVRKTLILPVFEHYRGIFVGVLELVMTSSKISYANEHVEAIRSPANEELDSRIDCFQSHQGLENGRNVLLESGQQSATGCVAFKNGRKVIHRGGQSRQSAVAFSDKKRTGTGESLKITPRKKRVTITLEMIQQHVGQTLVDAAKSLKVSRSTLKRDCRKLGITMWPSKMMMSEGLVPISESGQGAGSYPTNASQLPRITSVGSNQLNSKFHGKKSRLACSQQQNFLSSSPAPDPTTDKFTPAVPCLVTLRQDNPNSPMTTTAPDPKTDQFTRAMPCVITPRQDNLSSAMTTIKATYGDDMIKFQIDSTTKRIIDQLKEGVAKRLKLQDGSYKMKYEDEDGDEILITCEDDAQALAARQLNYIFLTKKAAAAAATERV